MADTWSEKRKDEIRRLVDACVTGDDFGVGLDTLCAFVESEIDRAFKRGTRYGGRPVGRGSDDPRARRTSNGRPLRYRSAVQGGVITRREGQHAAQ